MQGEHSYRWAIHSPGILESNANLAIKYIQCFSIRIFLLLLFLYLYKIIKIIYVWWFEESVDLSENLLN